MNLQLCFINNSESEEDEKKEEINKKGNSSTWVTTVTSWHYSLQFRLS